MELYALYVDYVSSGQTLVGIYTKQEAAVNDLYEYIDEYGQPDVGYQIILFEDGGTPTYGKIIHEKIAE